MSQIITRGSSNPRVSEHWQIYFPGIVWHISEVMQIFNLSLKILLRFLSSPEGAIWYEKIFSNYEIFSYRYFNGRYDFIEFHYFYRVFDLYWPRKLPVSSSSVWLGCCGLFFRGFYTLTYIEGKLVSKFLWTWGNQRCCNIVHVWPTPLSGNIKSFC